MIPADLAITSNDIRLPLRTSQATQATLQRNAHGVQAITCRTPLPPLQAFDLINRAGASLRATISIAGRSIGARVEDITIDDTGAQVQALGDWQAFSDLPYTALWSSTSVERWRPSQTAEIATRNPESYLMDTNNRLFIGLKKGATYPAPALAKRAGSLVMEVPDKSGRNVAGAQFTITYNLPANWTYGFATWLAGWTGGATIVSLTPAGSGTRAYHLTFTTRPNIEFYLNNIGVAYPNTQEDGDYYIRVTNLRVVSDTTNRVNTTLTANVTAGSNKSCPVGSTAGMYVGMDLVFDSGNANSEIATVSSITSGTVVVVATLANAHTSGQAVQGHRVLADAIAKDVRDAVIAVNPDALNSSNALIESPGLDLLDVVYEDASMADALAALAAQGDASGQIYEVGVDDARRVFFWPAGTNAQAWYVDAASLQVQRSLSQLTNSAYGIYQSAGGRALRTAAVADATSVAQFGLTRRQAAPASTTTNSTLATQAAQTVVDNAASPPPRASVTFDRVYTASGAQAPLWQVRGGDTITIRNLPLTAGATIDQIRTFRIADTTYDLIADTLQVTPAEPLPDLARQLGALLGS